VSVAADVQPVAPAWEAPGAVLLISCYELGRQPFNIASPWAQLEAAGFGVTGVDTAIDQLPTTIDAELVAISVPMHTALRLGVEIARQVRERAPAAHICLYGMYASLNAAYLLESVADSVIGGEFEEALVGLARALSMAPDELRVDGVVSDRAQLDGDHTAPPVLRKLPFVTPRRDELAPPARYATFFGPTEGQVRQVGYVEASRGCKHRCSHCPLTPVYQGRFFVVPKQTVLEDADQQIAAGAEHITFGDPDFFNGPKHAMAVARALHERHPTVSFDVTIKVEHILAHRDLFAELGQLGCAFVISAVESLSDDVLGHLAKGHTRRDVLEAFRICREAGVPLRPSLVSFTPWTTLEGYIEVVDWIVREGLIDHLEPIQLAIRLLIPPGSALLWQDAPRPWLGPLRPAAFGYQWTHPDPRMDQLFEQVSTIVEQGADDDPAAVVDAIRSAAYRAAGRQPSKLPRPPRHFVPHLSESWFCCAEPTARQLGQLRDGSACKVPSC